ncbi:unnamed protein product, partial [Urochloa humidicola]
QASSNHGRAEEVPGELPHGGFAWRRAQASTHHSGAEEPSSSSARGGSTRRRAPASSVHERSARWRTPMSSCNNCAWDDPDERRPQRICAATEQHGDRRAPRCSGGGSLPRVWCRKRSPGQPRNDIFETRRDVLIHPFSFFFYYLYVQFFCVSIFPFFLCLKVTFIHSPTHFYSPYPWSRMFFFLLK